jgi:hypothetical protein
MGFKELSLLKNRRGEICNIRISENQTDNVPFGRKPFALGYHPR